MHYGAPQNNPPKRNHRSSPSIAQRTSPFSASSDRHFAQLENTFNSLITKADRVF